MMKVIATVLLLTFTPTVIWAAPCVVQNYGDPKKTPNWDCPSPGEDSLVPRLQLRTSVSLKAESKAPWAGVLMDKDRVLTLGLRIKALRRLRWMDQTRFAEIIAVNKEYDESIKKVEIKLALSQRDSYKSQTTALAKEVESLRAWWRHPAFWFAMGMVVTAASATALGLTLRK
jgi:hypothetical protein